VSDESTALYRSPDDTAQIMPKSALSIALVVRPDLSVVCFAAMPLRRFGREAVTVPRCTESLQGGMTDLPRSPHEASRGTARNPRSPLRRGPRPTVASARSSGRRGRTFVDGDFAGHPLTLGVYSLYTRRRPVVYLPWTWGRIMGVSLASSRRAEGASPTRPTNRLPGGAVVEEAAAIRLRR
jgi:hypothetical protein